MSDAVVCDDLNLDRKVLIKSLGNDIDQKRIDDEIAALQAIRSKHVVQIYDVIRAKSGDVEAIVDEFLPGKDLVAVGKVQHYQDWLKIAYQLACGISDIHEHGGIHRDIKRQNVKFDAEGCLKIFDFGLARLDSSSSSTISIIGTPYYMAPELFVTGHGGKVKFTSAVDVFAFAATVFVLVAGKLPECLAPPTSLPDPKLDFGTLSIGIPAVIVTKLNDCFAVHASERPKMREVRDLLHAHLTYDKHRALIVAPPQVFELHSSKRTVKLNAGQLGGVTISYDGLNFTASNINGNVSINNETINGSKMLPGSRVITLGHQDEGFRRRHVTVDISHPEAMI